MGTQQRRLSAPTFTQFAVKFLFILCACLSATATPAGAQAVTQPTYGLNFGPYLNGADPNLGAQVTPAQIQNLLTAIAPYTAWVRFYGSTHGLQAGPAIAKQLNLKVAATAALVTLPSGTTLGSVSDPNMAEINALIVNANAGTVDIAILGTEPIRQGVVTVAQLIQYLQLVRAAVPSTVKIATSDIYPTFLNNTNLIGASDIVFANFYPYWEGTSINTALCSLEGEYQQLKTLAGSVPVAIGETGWPSAGNSVGSAVPSSANASLYENQFLSWANTNSIQSFYFEAYDEAFKAQYEGPQGANFGIWNSSGALKSGMSAFFNGQNTTTSCVLPGSPGISLTYVPPYSTPPAAGASTSSNDSLEVQATGVNPANYVAATYIQVNSVWYNKPTLAQPTVPLNADGTASINITTGGAGDYLATNIAVFLIPSGTTPPAEDGTSGTLPAIPGAVASVQIARAPGSISGTVTDAQNNPLQNASISDPNLGTTASAKDGKYSFPDITSNGTAQLTVTYPNYQFAASPANLTILASNQQKDFSGSSVDLSVTSSVSPSQAVPGSGFTETIVVANEGLGPATGAIATASIPATFSFASATTTTGSCSATATLVTCNIGALASNAFATITVVLTPSVTGQFTLFSGVSGPDAQLNTNDKSASQNVTVLATQTIAFGTIPTQTITASPYTLTAIASSALAVTYSSNNLSVCTVSGASVALLAAGTCSITANQPGTSSYAAAAPVIQTFSVVQAMQTISVSAIGPFILGNGTVALAATATSGLSVTYTASPASVCTIAVSTLTLAGAGNCTVLAIQVGNATYSAATPVMQTFAVLAVGTKYGLSGGGQITTIAGKGSGADGTPAITAAIQPAGIVVDSAGNYYFSEPADYKVRRVDGTTGIVTTVAGTGTSGFSGDGGLATSANLSGPAGLALDGAGNLYIADSGNGRVRMVSATDGSIVTVAGGGADGDGALATTTAMSQPVAIAFDKTGNLYIADQLDQVVREVVTSTGIITTVVGVSHADHASSGDGGPAVVAHLNQPNGLAIDSSGDMLIEEPDRVRRVDGASAVIDTFAGGGVLGSALGDGALATSSNIGPRGIALDSGANLYISDSLNSRIRRVDTSGVITTVAGNGTAGNTGDGGPALAAEVSSVALALDAQGNIYLSTASTIRFILASAITRAAQTIAFTPISGQIYPVSPILLSATASSGLPVTFSSTTPSVCTVSGAMLTLVGGGLCSVTATQAGSPLYVPATATQTFAVALSGSAFWGVASTGEITTIAGDGVPAYTGDGGPADRSTLNLPVAVALDTSGNVYIADSANNVIREINVSTGAIATIAGNGQSGFGADGVLATTIPLSDPIGIAIDSAGNIYFAEQGFNKIREISKSTGLVSTFAGTGDLGYTGDNSLATVATLNSPNGLVFDSAGNLYIADSGNNVIRKVAANGVISTVAGNGNADYTGDGGAAVSAALNFPFAVAVDSARNLYIADSRNSVIRKVIASTGTISTIAGGATAAFEGDGGPALSALLNLPLDVAVDSNNNVYIADYNNGRIRELFAATGIVDTIAGNGALTPNPLGDGGPAPLAQLTDPSGIALDTSGNLYIADYYGNRVRFVLGASQIKSQTMTFPAIPDQPAESPAFQIGASASSGLPVVLTSASVAICSVSGTTVKLLAPGVCRIAANQAGNAVYAAAGPIYQSFNVVGLPQTITFPTIPTQLYSSTIPLVASAGSGLPVIFTDSAADTDQQCQVSGSYLHIQTPVSCTITASQPGNALYAPATPVTQTFQVLNNEGSSYPGDLITIAGIGIAGNAGDGSFAGVAQLDEPEGIAFDSNGNYYIADTFNNRVRVVSVATGNNIQSFAGNGVPGFGGDGAAATLAKLKTPKGVALDTAGNVYIADTGNNSIRKVTTAGIITTIAGTPSAGYTGDGGPASAAALSTPVGIAVDAAGNVYIADSGNSAVRKINAADGTIDTIANVDAAGGIAVDAAGDIYVGGLSQIREIATGTNNVTVVAGLTTAGFSGDGGLATAAMFQGPLWIALDGSGNLIVSDSGNNRLRGIDASTGIVTTLAGTGTGGYNGQGAALLSDLNQPTGLSVDSADDVYVVDTMNNRVRFVSQTSPGLLPQTLTFPAISQQVYGAALLTPPVSASSGLPVTLIASPASVCSAAGNQITLVGAGACEVVARQFGNSVYAPAFPVAQLFTVVGEPQTIALTLSDQYLGDPTPLAPVATSGLAVTFSSTTPSVCNIASLEQSNGSYTSYVYSLAPGVCSLSASQPGNSQWAPATLSQSFNVSVTLSASPAWGVTAAGEISTLAGYANDFGAYPDPGGSATPDAGSQLNGGTGGPAMLAGVARPNRVAIDSSGNVYVSGSNSIRRIAAADGTLSTILGNPANATDAGDGGTAVNASTLFPQGMAFDSSGNLYFVDAAEVRKVTASGSVVSRVAAGAGGGLAFDSAGNLYIGSGSTVRQIAAGTGAVTTFAGGQAGGYSGDGGPATSALLNGISDLAFDPAGNLYIADSGNNAIRKIDTHGIIGTIAGNGLPGFTADGQLAASSQLNNPASIAVDRNANIYIAESGNNRIRVINAVTGFISTIAGNGTAGFEGDPGSFAIGAELDAPGGVATDAAGNVYIADTKNNRVRFVLISGSFQSQTITFPPPPSIGFGASQALVASATSGLPVIFASDTPSLCTVSGTTVTVSSTYRQGACSIIAEQHGNNIFAAAPSLTQTFAILPASQTIAFPLPANVPVGAPVTLGVTASSDLAVVLTSNTPSICTVAGEAVTGLAVGTCSITANQSGNSSLFAAPAVTQTFPVTQGSQTIIFPAPLPVTLPASAFTLTAISTSGLAVVFTTGTPAICTVDGTTLTPLAAGTCAILATQPGNVNYLPATSIAQYLTINPAPGSGGGSGGGGAPLGGGPPLNISPSSVTINAATGGSPGTATITLSYQTFTQGAPGFSVNFNLNQGQGWLSVAPAVGVMSLGSTSGLLFTYTATVTIFADPTTLTGGTYTGTVNVTSAGSIVSVPVTLNVTSQPAKYTVVPQSLSFSYQQGSTTQPAPQSLSVFSTPSGGTFTASASSTGNWLSIGAGNTTPVSFAVSVTTTGLLPNTYKGTITITAGSSVSLSVPVTLTITKASPPILAVSPALQHLNATQGQIAVSNTGGGTLQFTASSDQSWLTTATSGSATPTAPASLAFSANPANLTPGVYTGHITVSGAGTSQTATIVLTVTNTATRIQIAQTGISMIAVAGGSAPQSQTVPISNSGTGTLNWSAQTSTTSGGNWLTASQNTGSVTISANTTGLVAGQYYGTVNILSANATNSPQTIAVSLNVVAATAAPGILVSTGGVLFEGNTALTQSINLYNPSATAITYSASAFTSSGSWLSISPASGTANPGANSIAIAADLTLIAGVQQGSVTIAFSDGSSATIQVVALVIGSSGHVVASARPMLATSICAGGKASYLIPIFREPSVTSTATVASAATIQLQLVDDCGNNVTSANGGAAQIAFSNGDPGLTLNDIGSGIWEATWVPQNAAKSVTLQAVATENGLSIGSSVSALSSETITVTAAGANAPPAPTGIANAASAGQATPQVVAPGSYIAIYGINLAGTNTPSATSLPLPTALNGTQLFLGGLPMPLLYAGAGQVNALVPEGLAPNATYPLTVVRGTTQSVPVPITVTELQPGAYTVDTSGSGAGIVTNALTGALIAQSNPAHAGDFLVIYATGLGQLTGQNGETEPTAGAAAPTTTIFHTNATVSVNIGGTTIPALFAGLTPDFAGLYQVNLQVPQGVTTGTSIPIQIVATDPTTGATTTGNTVTITIQ